MPTELPKAYDPKAAQERWLKFWDEKGYFHSEPDSSKPPYTIVIPPPNVTGALHMGHALNNTLQDVLIRWRRMQGYNALWMPGTDHAGIATQAVVEKLVMQTEKKSRHDLGREELVKRIWQWKDKYEARILGQLKELGASADWARTRFTLDPQCARAVRETFFRMFRDGYIYRGKRLVNWDAHLQTSVADDETYTEDTKGGFWTFKYPVTGMPDTFVRFSTTRPETMLGDTALCVHPNDERYKHLVGKTVTLPLVGREIPIIADGLLADPELGTGCVKVTPAHDPNDYACWQRHPEIGIINILNPDGTINENGGRFAGLDRYKAREAVAQAMDELGLFEGKEDRVIPLKYSDRSKTPIEPYLSDQWFVKMGDLASGGRQPPGAILQEDETGSPRRVGSSGDSHRGADAPRSPGLAQTAMDAVTSGRVKFFPERYAKTYLDWLGEKRDWCVSRQLWWGHRIPVWSKLLDESVKFGSTDPTRIYEPTSDEIAPLGGIKVSFSDRPTWNENACVQVMPAEGGIRWRMLICVRPGHDEIEKELEKGGYEQDPDVLDTWFSSALWPHSTLGWPEPTPELRYYYPTSTLVTSRDIITLWVARMVITGLYNVGDVPFRHVYIHPQLQDAFGERMNKTTGNGIDPLDIIERYGTDALRYQILTIAGDTQDSRMPVFNVCPFCDTLIPIKQEHLRGRTKKLTCPNCKKAFRPGGPWTTEDPELVTAKQASDRFEIGRNFANKLWNATRFLQMNLDGYTAAAVNLAELPTEDRWIVSRLATTTKAVTDALESYKFADVARLLYDFTWSEFCDWYIEMSKGRLRDPAARPLAQRVLVGVLDGILRLVQPVMPFVAESLWEALNEAAPQRGLPTPTVGEESVVIAKWPSYPAGLADARTEASIARMQDLVRGVREVRNRYGLDKAKLNLVVKCPAAVAAELGELSAFVRQLGGVEEFTCGPDVAKPKQSGTFIHADFEAFVPLAGLIDPAAEAKRLEKQIGEKRKQLDGSKAKLGNENFVKKAPPEQVQEVKDKVAELEGQITAMEENLKDLN